MSNINVSYRILSLVVGWLHVVSAAASSVGLLIYMCAYHNKTYEGTEKEEQIIKLGFHVLFLLFIFSVADMFFAILLLRGIVEDRIKLMAPFVFGNYTALVILSAIIVIDLVVDIVSDGKVWRDFGLNSAEFLVTLILFWPVYKLYHQMRDYPEHQHLSESGATFKSNYGEDVEKKLADNPTTTTAAN